MTTSPPAAPRQSGPTTWTAADYPNPSQWTWQLSPGDIDALVEATTHFAEHDVDALPILTTGDVALPDEMAGRLGDLRRTLISGRGFAVLSGLPVAEIGDAHAAAVFLAVGAYVGAARSQNAHGDLLGHVRDVGADVDDPTVRIYQTSQRQTFHTDSADAVGLLCLCDAESGGESLLVSAATVYNEMLDIDANLARLLFEPIATDRRGEVRPGQRPYFTIPVLNWFEDELTVIYQRQYIESAQRHSNVPRLSDSVSAALDLFDSLANRPDLHLRMSLRPGDMQFVHNHSLLHDRTGFIDRPEAPRHLLRLWLSVPGDRALPDVFAERYGTVTVGDRGGV